MPHYIQRSAAALEGKRIRYARRDCGRTGWTGTIAEARPDSTMPGGARVIVHFDNGVTQVYSRDAVREDGTKFDGFDGYLEIIGEVSEEKIGALPTYFVQGRKGGSAHPAFSEHEAHEQAKKRAQQSKSGQAYMVLKVLSDYTRDEPPVVRKDYE